VQSVLVSEVSKFKFQHKWNLFVLFLYKVWFNSFVSTVLKILSCFFSLLFFLCLLFLFVLCFFNFFFTMSIIMIFNTIMNFIIFLVVYNMITIIIIIINKMAFNMVITCFKMVGLFDCLV